ncbi:MAG: glutathione S-transferase family protein [Proteobacteria bacterium]|nr:glutathione S-transferase family protein [Pseudomonadota bacterium]
MLKYKLYYWDVPFRGNFIQLFLEEVNAKYKRYDVSEIYPNNRINISYPAMAPPYLYDCKSKKYFAQMPAILMHLGKIYNYIPKRSGMLTLALKTILDCNDILMEITNNHGTKMWSKKNWKEFRCNRLSRWMMIFEKTGLENGLKKDKGFLLGSTISVADIATTALFGTLVYCFPELKNDLHKNAPSIKRLCQRIENRLAIRAFLQGQREEYGKVYCGGKIENSLRKMIGS